MDIQTAIKECIRERGTTQAALSAEMGMNRVTMSYSLGARQRSMGVEAALRMLSRLGYDLVVVPVGARLPSGARVVTPKVDDEGAGGPDGE